MRRTLLTSVVFVILIIAVAVTSHVQTAARNAINEKETWLVHSVSEKVIYLKRSQLGQQAMPEQFFTKDPQHVNTAAQALVHHAEVTIRSRGADLQLIELAKK